jgi:hypothetical protein
MPPKTRNAKPWPKLAAHHQVAGRSQYCSHVCCWRVFTTRVCTALAAKTSGTKRGEQEKKNKINTGPGSSRTYLVLDCPLAGLKTGIVIKIVGGLC